MAKLRKWVAYRSLERPYTRVSKFLKKSYIRVKPPKKVIRFDMGNNSNPHFPVSVDLSPASSLQIRQEAIESARKTTIRFLEKNIDKKNFHFKIRRFPFHILRENRLGGKAGADRTSTGMKHSFGKVIGSSLQIKKGQKLFTISVNEDKLDIAKEALTKASKKMPCKFTKTVNFNDKK